jgi:ATP-dependent 26S proteasome regulatory subunit
MRVFFAFIHHLLQDSYLILEKLPAEYDSRVKAMEVDTKPTEEWGDIGGCDKQIQVRACVPACVRACMRACV